MIDRRRCASPTCASRRIPFAGVVGTAVAQRPRESTQELWIERALKSGYSTHDGIRPNLVKLFTPGAFQNSGRSVGFAGEAV